MNKVYRFYSQDRIVKYTNALLLCVWLIILNFILFKYPSFWRLILATSVFSIFAGMYRSFLFKFVFGRASKMYIEVGEEGLVLDNGTRLIKWGRLNQIKEWKILGIRCFKLSLDQKPFLYFLFIDVIDLNGLKFVFREYASEKSANLLNDVEAKPPINPPVVVTNLEEITRKRATLLWKKILVGLLVGGVYIFVVNDKEILLKVPLMKELLNFTLGIEVLDEEKEYVGVKWPIGSEVSPLHKSSVKVIKIFKEFSIFGINWPVGTKFFIEDNKIDFITAPRNFDAFGYSWDKETIASLEESENINMSIEVPMKIQNKEIPKGSIIRFENGKPNFNKSRINSSEEY